jgi:hypothetical protein
MAITDAYNGKFPSSMGGLSAQYENAYKGGYVPSVHSRSSLKYLTSRSARSARSSRSARSVKSQSMKMKRKKGKKTQGKGKKTQGGRRRPSRRQAPWTKKNRTRSKR